jgi:rod shape-determining protein MreC
VARSRQVGVSRLATPAQAVVQRFGVPLLVAVAFALLVLSRTESEGVARLRVQVVDALAPVLDVMAQPVLAVNRILGAAEQLLYTYSENARLREANERLLQWEAVARRLEQENALYRALLNVQPDMRPTYVTARVIGDAGGPFVRTLLVNAGRRDGVMNGQAAVAAGGLAGRIVEAGERSARLLLLTDLNSRVPVVLESSRYRAVLAGDNTAMPRLSFLPTNAQARVGDRLVTSGHGGVFPPGLPVGVVSAVHDSEIRVQPFAAWDRIEYVSVLQYEVPRLFEDAPRPPPAPAADGQGTPAP